MDPIRVRELLTAVAAGQTSVEEAIQALRALPYEELGFALLDSHRALRGGFPEVIYCPGKTEKQVAAIVERLAAQHPLVLGTRANPAQYEAARHRVSDLRYHEIARALWLDRTPERPRQPGIAIVTAGTGDLPVAEEAALTLNLMGHAVERIYDVGVAGLHRLQPYLRTLQNADVLIVVAGMDGALPSVIGGLVAAPVIAVPTSVGYGANLGGLATLLAMLNSCAPGVAVVNIDNGFGAAVLAARIKAQIIKARQS